jgi:hypothetical protein
MPVEHAHEMNAISVTDGARVFLSAATTSRARTRALEFDLRDSGLVERAQCTDGDRDQDDEESASDEK